VPEEAKKVHLETIGGRMSRESRVRLAAHAFSKVQLNKTAKTLVKQENEE